jgi:hypothetical protein
MTHSPPLPPVVNYFDKDHDIITEDEAGIILALQHRDRVRRIRLRKLVRKLIGAFGGEFPSLEYLLIEYQPYPMHTIEDEDVSHITMSLPETFRAPHLRHLVLMNLVTPIGSQSLMTMGNFVTLSLSMIPPSVYVQPNALLQRLSLMPQLETFGITFNPYYRFRNVENQILRTPIMTRVTLPILRCLVFQGTSTYLEALLPWVTFPLLERLHVYLFNRPTYSIPHLRLRAATLNFCDTYFSVTAYPQKGVRMYSLDMALDGIELDWQVASAARVFHTLETVFSAVEHFTLRYDRGFISPGQNEEADRAQWRELLGSFGNVKTLHVEDYELVLELSHALRPCEGESPTKLLPELQELSYPADGFSCKPFTHFIDARQKAGRPVTMIYR